MTFSYEQRRTALRWFLPALIVAISSTIGHGGNSSEGSLKAVGITPAQTNQLTARDVVRQLFLATEDEPIDLSGKKLENLDLAGVDFKRANLKGASLFGTDLSGADLSGCNLEGANLDRATLTKTNFSNANLRTANIRRPSIFTSMSPVVDEAPTFERANLESAWIEGILDYADFSGSNLVGARFGATNPRDNQGIIAGPRLRGANFANADLSAAILERADLSFASFLNAKLDGANLRSVVLIGTNLFGASLQGADLSAAQLDGKND